MPMRKKTKYTEVVREGVFEAVGEVKTDSKNRVCLKNPVSTHYRIYRNDAGQIILDPQVLIPAREAWLYKNPKALASVRRGLQQASEGKGRRAGSFAKYADAPDE